MIKEIESKNGSLRVLSFNLTSQPIGYGAFQQERIDTFVSLTDSYDVLLLQEVYPSSFLPYPIQRFLCAQNRLLDRLRAKGFLHYVVSRQPSYKTMLQYNIISNNGLVIASRFPICRHGSYTFRSAVRKEEHSVTHGCLFAEVSIPATPTTKETSLVLFNIHLKTNSSSQVGSSSHVRQAKQFVYTVMNQLSSKQYTSDHRIPISEWLPFVIAGDFDVHGCDNTSMKPSKEFTSLRHDFEPLNEMYSVLFDDLSENTKRMSIPATRTPQPFFSPEPALEGVDVVPQREDYFFVSQKIKTSQEHLEKFVVGRRPYVYLSDHYGIAVTLRVTSNKDENTSLLSVPRRLNLSSVVEEAVNEETEPISSVYYFALLLMLCVGMLLFSFSRKFLFAVLLLVVSAMISVRRSLVAIPPNPPFGRVTDDVLAGAKEVEWSKAVIDDLFSYDDSTLKCAWNRAVKKYVSLPCIVSRGEMTSMASLPFTVVDERLRHFGQGLLSLGLGVGEKIGVHCDACRDALVFDLVCLKYGFASVSLCGTGNIVRGILDQNHIRVVCSTPNKIYSLLSSRSTALETIICLDGFPLDADMSMAKDLNINITSSSNLREQGRFHVCEIPEVMEGSTVWTYVMNNVSTSNFTELSPVTHADVLRDLKALRGSNILPRDTVLYRGEAEKFVWYSPFGFLFPRICALGMLFTGGCVVTTDPNALDEVCRSTNPTIFVAQPALFRQSMQQMSRQNKAHRKIYRCLSRKVYNACSSLIHTQNKDCPILRKLFFQSFYQQLGNSVKKIVLYTSQETTSFDVVEHVTVCYVPQVREVFYLNHLGVCAVDGIPAPGLKVSLDPVDELSEVSAIGSLSLSRDNQQTKKIGIAARWEKHRSLTLMDAIDGILWPVDYHYAIAVELERFFSLSRYVVDILVFCLPGQSVIAVVYPNKDTVEYACRNISPSTKEINFGWRELVAFGSELILEDLRCIGKKYHLHHSQIPRFIHLHPHAFRDHLSFLNPFGKPCRPKMIAYFEQFFVKIYNASPVSPTMMSQELFSDVESNETDNRALAGMTVPFTIDIGGTFAKLAYVMPPGITDLATPEFLIHEASSLSKTLGLRVFQFFKNESAAEREIHECPLSSVGTVRFMKVPTAKILDLAQLMKQYNALGHYKSEFTRKIRATGGGAFKYAHVAQEVLGTSFDVVKEMDAVVKGLNLVIQLTPSSIFTVNPDTGEKLPHKLQSQGSTFSPFPYLLINIGSGISFIKCTGPDGAHVRVGGSPIGGATFWGLTRTLTHLTSWEEVLEIMRLDGPGDNKNVDLLVGDIYGYNAKDLPAMLSSETVASSFGKYGVERRSQNHAHSRNNSVGSDTEVSVASLAEGGSEHFSGDVVDRDRPSSIDIVRSLLNMLSGNVTQLAYLHSKLHGVKNIFFAGGFVRENHILWSLISQTMKYWSSGECAAHFLEHDGYLGALGCTILNRTDE